MRIAVVDGQGGGIGKNIIERIRKELDLDVYVLALGTNAIATATMIKSGANEGATGENAIVQNANDVDVIIGTISIVLAHSMLGEMTPRMAEAIANSKAKVYLLPLTRSRVQVVGVATEPLPHYVDILIQQLKEIGRVNDQCVKRTHI